MDTAVKKWNPLDPLLVSSPASARFLPVLHVAEYGDRVHRSVLRRQLAAVVLLGLVTCMLLVSGYVADRPSAMRAAMMSLAIASFAAADYWLVVRHLERLKERALLTLWLYEKAPPYLLVSAITMLVAGAAQLYLESVLGGREALLLELGVVFTSVHGGELWRLASGPFFHTDLAHWFTNAAMLAMACAIAGPFLGTRTLLVFVGGSAFGALASTALAAFSPFDAYLGVSAGILALLGWCAGAAQRRPGAFPSCFVFTIGAFALLIAAVAAIATDAASNIGHFSGLLFGVACGLWVPAGTHAAGAAVSESRPT